MASRFKSTDISRTATVGAKIRGNEKEMLKAIAASCGLTPSDMLHCVINSYFRYLSPDTIITPQMELLVNNFADFRIAKDSFVIFDGNTKKKRSLKSAIVFVKQKGKPQAQPVLLYQKNNEKGETQTFESINNDRLLLAFLHAFAPKVLPDLREIQTANNLLSLTDALKFAVREQTAPTRYEISITNEIESLFADNSRGENGKVIDYDDISSKYIRHYAVSVNDKERENRIPQNRK